jgi:hypothetical protein
VTPGGDEDLQILPKEDEADIVESGQPEKRANIEIERNCTASLSQFSKPSPSPPHSLASAASERKNIFRIARRGSADDEDQLTELLACLIQEEPEVAPALLRQLGFEGQSCSATTQRRIQDGRLDLEIKAPGISVVIESKLR